MGKVFRIFDDANRTSTIQGWGDTAIYAHEDIARIKDPNGDTPNRDITSIPTPWARLELVKQAFREVARQGLDGQSIYHRMVSDALDVAEIFFNIDKLRDQFEILEWEVGKGLDAMKRSVNEGVQLMGKGLSLYRAADGQQYTSLTIKESIIAKCLVSLEQRLLLPCSSHQLVILVSLVLM